MGIASATRTMRTATCLFCDRDFLDPLRGYSLTYTGLSPYFFSCLVATYANTGLHLFREKQAKQMPWIFHLLNSDNNTEPNVFGLS